MDLRGAGVDRRFNFQASATEQGRWFQLTSERALEYAGFEIADRQVTMRDIGVEVDIIAHNRHAIAFYVTCKGSIRGDRPGIRRTDTLKKALCEVVALHHGGFAPLLIFTSHSPDGGSGAALLRLFRQHYAFEVVDPIRDSRRIRWLAEANEAALLSGFALPELQRAISG